MWIESPFFRTFALITASLAAGYFARRRRLVPERAAKWLMTAVTVVGYSTVGFLSIWGIEIGLEDIWLPVMSASQIVLMALLGLGVGKLITSDQGEVGLLGLSSAIGNHGATMGGFVIFLIYGSEGLGISSIYCLSFSAMMVLVLFPIARHYSGRSSELSLGRLMLRSALDWRAVGMVFAVTAIVLSVTGVPRPAEIDKYHVIAICIYAINALAYFSIGLRLRIAYVGRAAKLLVALAGTRFVASIAVCLGLLGLTLLTGRPVTGLRRNVVLIQAFVPTAVTVVAVANMFDLRPRQASVLFVVNTLAYLVLVLPLVFYLFS